MKSIPGLIFAATLASLAPMNTPAQSPKAALIPEKFPWKTSQSGELACLVYLPKNYSATNGQHWPLMLFLHGAGERGSDVQRAGIHGPLKLVKQGREFPFIIIAPQCPEKQIWQSGPLLQLLDHVTAKFSVDPRRIYLTGLSMGGYGTWQLGMQHPEKFAALVPICGGANLIEAIVSPADRGDALKNLPIWAFHGAKDDVVPLDESERIIKELKKRGCRDVKLTVYPEARHDSWTEAYQTPELYEWLAKQSR